MVAQLRPPAQRFDTDELYGIRQEGREHTDGVGAAAHTGCDLVREMTGLLEELGSGLLADTELEIADHQGEGMRPRGRSDAVDRVLVFSGIGHEGGVDRLFEGLEAKADRDDIGAKQLHAGHIRSLFGDVDLSHVDVALEPEISCSGRQGDSVLPCPGLRDQLLFAHIFSQETFTHAVVELVGAGVVEVLAFEIDLGPAQKVGQVLAVIDRCGTALEIPADAAELRNELGGLGDRVIALRVLIKGFDQLRILQVIPAVLPEISVVGRIFFEVIIKISVFIHLEIPFCLFCFFYLSNLL